MPKNYSGTFIYGKYPDYDKMLFEFIMQGEVIDKEAEGFDDIIYEVKRRQVSPALVKVLKSDGVVLITAEKQLPRQFKAFCAKDLKGGKKNELKVYIDCTDTIVKSESGVYTIKNVDKFISYLVSAMVFYIYYKDDKRLISNASVIRSGAKAFSDLITNVIDHLSKISSMPKQKAYCKYLCTLYYVGNILDKDVNTPSNLALAKQISGLTDREADIVNLDVNAESFTNIKFFTDTLANILRIPKLTVDVIVEKWMFLYGVSTVFALELFPAFSTMMTDCYVGAYVNNQKTIEKIAGSSMVEFSKTVLRIGAESV